VGRTKGALGTVAAAVVEPTVERAVVVVVVEAVPLDDEPQAWSAASATAPKALASTCRRVRSSVMASPGSCPYVRYGTE